MVYIALLVALIVSLHLCGYFTVPVIVDLIIRAFIALFFSAVAYRHYRAHNPLYQEKE